MKNNPSSTNYTSLTSILKYQINASGYKYPLDAYCEPLYWYTKMYCKQSSSKRMQDIAHDLHIDSGLLTKKLNINSSQHRELTINDIEKLCSIMQISLLSIIQIYEHRDLFKKNPSLFDKLTSLSITDFEKMLENQGIYESSNIENVSKRESEIDGFSENTIKEVLESEADQPELQVSPSNIDSWARKWYFYFPSSDSAIIEHRKKKILKEDANVDQLDCNIRELFELYSDDHIYSGVLTISPCINEEQITYQARLEYLTNPLKRTVASYEGVARLSVNGQAIFVALNNLDDNDMIYIIIDTLNVEPDFQFAMASVLTLSKNKRKSHRRPCSLRMILSQDIIPTGTKMYNIMCSNLMMNDSIIRIDEHGYNELKKYQAQYASSALDLFLKKYPDIDTMESSSNFINVHKCAYITESLIYNLKDTDSSETLYLEALLRLHSTASWYSKAKAVKANKLLSMFSSDNE